MDGNDIFPKHLESFNFCEVLTRHSSARPGININCPSFQQTK
jgi:hypothetical protein